MKFSRNRFIVLLLFLFMTGCVMIPPPVVTPFEDQENWVLLQPLEYRIKDINEIITVPRGFVTDFASVPRAFCHILTPHGKHSRAAIVHDYLYWTQGCSKAQADNIMRIAMIECGVKKSDIEIIYRTLQFFGQKAWDKNETERLAGKPRIIPEEYLPIPADATWTDYRLFLQQKGVPVDTLQGTPSYCTMGDG